MIIEQFGVDVHILPDDAHCILDENKVYILDLEECPLGYMQCNGDCYYYTESKEINEHG